MHSVPTHRPDLRSLRWPLDCLLGLPAWPAWPAWASVLPVIAFRTPIGRQLHATWTPSGCQVSSKLDCQNGCQCQRTSSGRQDSCQVPQNALPTVCLSLYSDRSTLVYIYIYIYMCVCVCARAHVCVCVCVCVCVGGGRWWGQEGYACGVQGMYKGMRR